MKALQVAVQSMQHWHAHLPCNVQAVSVTARNNIDVRNGQPERYMAMMSQHLHVRGSPRLVLCCRCTVQLLKASKRQQSCLKRPYWMSEAIMMLLMCQTGTPSCLYAHHSRPESHTAATYMNRAACKVEEVCCHSQQSFSNAVGLCFVAAT